MQILEFKCPICNEPGVRRAIERLPKAGLAMGCFHADGTVHRWAEFSSIDDMIVKNKRKDGSDPRIIICPECGHKGRINDYHRNPQRPDVIAYVVIHEKIKGTWGKEKKQRYKRHWISKKEQRDIILKKLGRYIPQPELGSLERYIEK
jgi:endogenous inhibitor of DNA gyrase (YacG/DUF329 family)